MSYDEQIINQEAALSAAKQIWNCDFKLIDYNVQSYSSERLGFLSLHRSLKIEIEETKTKTRRHHTFFVKCLPPKDDPLALCMADMGVFDREIAFYRDIVPSLRINFKDLPWSPMCYGITDNAMILEDLRNRNFSLSSSKTFSYEEMKSLLSAIARMQSASIIAERRLGKPLYEVYPEAFGTDAILKPDGFFRKWYQTGVNLGIQLAKQLGLPTDKIQSSCDKMFDCYIPAKDKQNVITHSDLWSNNIMFDNNSPPVCTLIDFQWTRYCPPAQDVILVLHYCADKEFREKYLDEMLKHHYGEMTRILEKHGLEMFSWEEFQVTIKEQTIVAKILMVLCFPSIFMDGDVCAEMMNDPKRFTEFMFSDKAPMTMMLLKRGGEYEKKVTEAVIDFVEYCKDFE